MNRLGSLMRIATVTFTATFVFSLIVMRAQDAAGPIPTTSVTLGPVPHATSTSTPDAGTWFRTTKPYCNAVEVENRLSRVPAPEGFQGDAHEAACWALAGRIDRARAIVESMDGDQRWRAVGVIFDIAHPVADAGNDIAAGPVMELVVEFWPNHYMALYHAGAARFQTGRDAADAAAAAGYLRRFLEHYRAEDGWTRSARSMLDDLR